MPAEIFLHRLILIHFKNYGQAQFEFDAGTVCITGTNGSGKTNLLDAIHYLSLTKSAFFSADQYAIRHGEPFFRLEGHFTMENNPLQVECAVQTGSKKLFKANGSEYEKLSRHIGEIPLVFVSPDDSVLVQEGNEERRRFFDAMLCQSDQAYLQQLVHYQHVLKQRNILLKKYQDTGRYDPSLLETYDYQLFELGKPLFEKRKEFAAEFVPMFGEIYARLGGEKETAFVVYKSDMEQANHPSAFQTPLRRDLALGRTTFGVHTDRFEFLLDGYPVRRFGSQGQKKCFTLALKLAQYQIIQQHTKRTPLLLLDDVFDKLDEERIKQLLEIIDQKMKGQVFITDARPERSRELLKMLNRKVQFVEIQFP